MLKNKVFTSFPSFSRPTFVSARDASRYAMFSRVLLGLSTVLVLSCGGAGSQTLTDDVAWQASLSVSGGITGVQRSITADSRGNFSVRESRDGPVHTRQLADARVRALGKQVPAFLERHSQTEGPDRQAWPDTDRGCADCVNFQLTVATNQQNKPATITWNSITPAAQRPKLGKLLLEYSEPPN